MKQFGIGGGVGRGGGGERLNRCVTKRNLIDTINIKTFTYMNEYKYNGP